MFVDRFVCFIAYEKRFSGHTLTAYGREVQQFVEYLASLDTCVDKVTHRQARAYLATRFESGRSPATVNRSLAALRTYYKFLMREGAVMQNPFTLVKALKAPKKLPVIVDKEKLSLLLDTEGVFADTFEGLRDKTVLELLFGTGIRLSELLQIRDEHLDFYNGNILIFGKRNKERLVPLNKALIMLLQHYIDEKKRNILTTIRPISSLLKKGRMHTPH